MGINKEQTFTKASWALFIIAIMLLLFSFFAPILFTNNYSKWDFTQTGQIGDTIGGIMNPFIAIGGVIATFLAFFMQIQANKIQREQFIKSLDKSAIDEKIDCYYKLDLIKVDIDHTVKDIDNRIKNIKTFTKSTKENPFKLVALYRSVLKNYDRIATLDRVSIYKGFKVFLSTDKEWILNFNNLYSSLDYVPEAFNNIYKIADFHNDDIYKDKSEIRDLLIKFDEECADKINRAGEINGHYASLNNYLIAYRAEIHRSLTNKQDTDIKVIKTSIEKLFKDIEQHNTDSELYGVSRSISAILILMNYVEQKSHHLTSELGKSEETMIDQRNVLDAIKIKIEKELNKTSAEQIRDEYNKS